MNVISCPSICGIKMSEEQLVSEVPSSLKQLARLVVRAFYTIEDALIIDMLVRNPCMREDDICELLKFERKMLRARISVLRADKFLQVRLRMETGEDGKAQKVNYYFINYKVFVNVVKYKLDLMQKRMETTERDATSRASFKCPQCMKTFTDLEADQLFDMATCEFVCTYCRATVEEDQSALPKQDSRLLLAKFNSQLEPLYTLLRRVEGIRLAPEVLEPDPVDISTIRGLDSKRSTTALRPPGEHWSGDSTRGQGFAVEEARVDVTIGENVRGDEGKQNRKERPVWMVESTVLPQESLQLEQLLGASQQAEKAASEVSSGGGGGKAGVSDDIMSVLLAHERRSVKSGGVGGSTNMSAAAAKAILPPDSSDSSDNENDNDTLNATGSPNDDIELVDSDEDDLVPMVTVGIRSVPISEVNDALISEMTPQEKEAYIQVYQEHYSHMYD